MIHEFKANAVVADDAIHSIIHACFGGVVPLVDAASWLAGVHRISNGGHSNASDHLTSDILAVAAVVGSSMEKELQSMALKMHFPFRSFELTQGEEIGKWVLEVAFCRVQETSVDAAAAKRAAAVLRQDLDQQQQAFFALENAILNSGMPLFSLAFDLPLTVDRLVLSGQERSPDSLMAHVVAVGCLHQRLPLSARRIAAVELHLELIEDCSMSDQLEVSISDLAGNILTKPVRINHSEVSPGWNRVNFSEVIDCTDRDAVLHLSFIGTGALAVTLAPSIPLERFHPKKHDNISVGDSPLAIKVWRGLSGIHPQLPDIKMSKGNHVRHRSGEMPKAFHYHTDGGDLDFEAVQYWANEDGFLVHPPSCGMTVGVIENLELKNLNSVTAFVNNAHREGPTLSFAIGLITRTGDSFQSVHIPDVLGPWLTLPPLGWGEVHVTLPESTSGKFDLFLVTMATKEQGNRLAWGLFRGFMFNMENPA